MGREGLTEKETSDQNPKGGKGLIQAKSLGEESSSKFLSLRNNLMWVMDCNW